MNDDKVTYGSATLEAPRWRRIVQVLDKHVPKWRCKHDYDGLGDDALSAIEDLARSALSLEPKPQPVLKAPSPRTGDDYLPSDLTQANLAQLILALVRKHGRPVAVLALKKFGAKRLQDLRLGDLSAFHEHALAELGEPARGPRPSEEDWSKHAEQYPNAHKGMRWRLDRIARGEAPLRFRDAFRKYP